MRSQISPDVGRLVGELCGHEGEVLPHLDPEVGFGDAAVVCMDGMDASHLPGYQSEKRNKVITVTTFQHEITTSLAPAIKKANRPVTDKPAAGLTSFYLLYKDR